MKKKDVCTSEMCAGGCRPIVADTQANLDPSSTCTGGQAMAFASNSAHRETAHHSGFCTPLVTVHTFVIALQNLMYTATNYFVIRPSSLDKHRSSKKAR